MRRTAGIVLAVAVGAAAIATPILISVRLAWRQSVAFEESRVSGYAQDALRRGNEMGVQMREVFQQLSRSGVAPCSPRDLDAMRRLDVGSAYLQAVNRISGDSLTCSSLGITQPISLGPATLSTGAGVRDWLHVRIPALGERPVTIVAQGDVAVLVDPQLALDTYTEGPDIGLALYFPSAGPGPLVIAGHGVIRPEWYRNIPKGATATFLTDGYVVSVTRAAHGDIAAIAAAPDTYVSRQVRRLAGVFIPIGVLCGLSLAGVVLYVRRVQNSLPATLRTAARRGEFFLEYQPIVDLQSQRWVGAEALVRWRRGASTVQPNDFIPTAEQSGVIPMITHRVAEMVAADMPDLLRIDPEFYISINLSAADLRSGDTLPLLGRLLRDAGARPENLQVEATEGGFLQGPESSNVAAGVRGLGIGLAIDDFGTGYSSLARLETLAPEVLKIDKSFVDMIGTGSPMSQVVPHIIEMGRSLKLTLVAEGVEREEQAEYLRTHGVGYAQGWLFGRPMRLPQVCALLAAQPAAAEAVAAAEGGNGMF